MVLMQGFLTRKYLVGPTQGLYKGLPIWTCFKLSKILTRTILELMGQCVFQVIFSELHVSKL